MLQSLVHGDVRVVKVGIFANNGNGDLFKETLVAKKIMFSAIHIPFSPFNHEYLYLPLCQVGPSAPKLFTSQATFIRDLDGIQVQTFAEEVDDTALAEQEGNMVNGGDIVNGQDLLGSDVTKHGDLATDTFIQGLGGTASNQIRVQTGTAKVTDAHLGRLSLLFANRSDNRNKRNMDQAKVLVTDTELELTHGLNEGSRFDITDGTTQFNNTNIRLLSRVIDGHSSDTLDPVLDSIRNVGYDLDSLAEIVTASLLLNNFTVDLASGNIVDTAQFNIQEPLIVAKIKVNLATVVKHKDLAFKNQTSHCVNP